MSYTVRTVVSGDVLEAQISGHRHSWASKDPLVAWKEVTEMARSAGLKKVLIDIRLKGTLSIPNAMNIGTNLGVNEWDESCKLAFLVNESDQITKQEFAQTIASSKGYRVRIFRDKDKARAWLAAD